MSLVFNALFFSLVIFGAFTMSIKDGIHSLFNWGSTGVVEDNRQTSLISGIQNSIQYGKSSVGIANTSEKGTNIGIKARVTLFTLFCDALELFLRNNPYYELMIQSVLKYAERMMCEDIGTNLTSATSMKAVRIAYVLAKDVVLNRFSLSLL